MNGENAYFRPKLYSKPGSIVEAVKLLAELGERGKPVAGGTDVMVEKRREVEALVDITGLNLSYIKMDNNGLRLGATTTLYTIEKSEEIKKTPYRILAQAAHKVGTPLIRNMGTIAGNICNASPSSDTSAVLLALGAVVRMVGNGKKREIPLDKFFAGPFRSVKEHDELVIEIYMPPLSSRTGTSASWLTKNGNIDESMVGVAVLVVLNKEGEKIEDVRIGLLSVNPTPMRAVQAETVLIGKKINGTLLKEAAQAAAAEAKPRSKADYRRSMTVHLVETNLKEAIAEARG
jgi:CO/xanthine dehydrogenase FAD-binding subunit